MVIKVKINNRFDIKQTSKIYAQEYASRLVEKLSKGIDKIDYYIVNH